MNLKRLGPFLVVALPLTALLLSRGQAETQGDNPHGDRKMSCADCHSPERWTPVDNPPEFRHQQTGFALEGSHAGLSCRSCHQSLVFSRVGTACADCHKDPHRGELGFRCETCHTSRSWTNRTEMFQRHSRTRFPLLAIHASVDCDSCHRGQQPNQYATTPTDCGSCHAQSYVNAKSPNHVQAGFSRRCEDCHPPTAPSWRQASFRHPDAYPLRGAHARAACGDCHQAAFRGTPRDCVACHRQNYTGTRNPNHAAAGFPTTCNSCHGMEGWTPASFVDHSRTRFPLTGAHQQADCGQCHTNGRFAGTPADCFSCHRQNYQGTTNPSHAAANFPTSCQSCHSTNAWRPASAIDHSRTRFPLTGAHQAVTCERCHVGGRFAGTPTDCFSCHQTSYNSASNPNHASAGFPTTCQTCHNTSAWRPASFDHGRTRFPLTGAHRALDCGRCHAGGRYAGTSTDCYACHRANYDATSNPNHRAAGFPTQCQSCHTTNAWRPASFDHDGAFFPINSGRHRGTWSSCQDCHVNPGNLRTFECINCHAHNRNEMDDKHKEVGGYRYQSAACYQCHPRGQGGD
jgi:hypothetical protein